MIKMMPYKLLHMSIMWWSDALPVLKLASIRSGLIVGKYSASPDGYLIVLFLGAVLEASL